MKHAAIRPAPADQSSLVRRYVAKAVRPLLTEQSMFHGIFLLSTLLVLPEEWSKENTNVSDVNRDVQGMQDVMYCP